MQRQHDFKTTNQDGANLDVTGEDHTPSIISVIKKFVIHATASRFPGIVQTAPSTHSEATHGCSLKAHHNLTARRTGYRQRRMEQ